MKYGQYQPDRPPFGRPWWSIVRTIQHRRRENSPLYDAMIKVKERYNGPALDFVLPWWSGNADEDHSQYTPLLIAELVDNQALQASSVDPEIYSPAIEPGKQKGVKSREYAKIRQGAMHACYEHSRWKLAKRKLFRQLSAYGSCCAVVLPDDRTQMPRIHVRDVLTAFPDLRAAEDFRDPVDIGFITGKSAEWLRMTYPEAKHENGGPIPDEPGEEEMIWDVLEWFDEEAVVVGILGPRESRDGSSNWVDGNETAMMEVRRWPNLAAIVPAMIPSKVTLDTVLSQVMNLTGHVDMIAKLQLIDTITSEKTLSPDKYILGENNAPPRIVSNGGRWADGRSGIMNEVMNARGIGTFAPQPDPLARATIDRLERNFRMSGGLMPQMSGETYGPLRTGRAIDSLAGLAVEPRIQELHEIMEAWQPLLNEAVLRTYDGYWRSTTFHLYTGKASATTEIVFKPGEHIEGVLHNSVKYAIAGAGVTETNVAIAQLLGSELVAKRTARRRHPWIDDPDTEQALIDEEAAEEAMKAYVFGAVMNREAPAELLQFFEEARRETDRNGNPKHPDAISAFAAANDRLKTLQATPAEMPPEGMPPEMMPGANAGPAGAMMQPPPDPAMLAPGAQGATPSQSGLREVFNALQATTREI